MQVGDAIYNSRWYEAEVTLRKYLLIVFVRLVYQYVRILSTTTPIYPVGLEKPRTKEVSYVG